MSAGFSKQFEVEGEKQAVVLQLTVLKWGRAVMGRGLPSTIEDCEGLPWKKFNFNLVINFYFYNEDVNHYLPTLVSYSTCMLEVTY